MTRKSTYIEKINTTNFMIIIKYAFRYYRCPFTYTGALNDPFFEPFTNSLWQTSSNCFNLKKFSLKKGVLRQVSYNWKFYFGNFFRFILILIYYRCAVMIKHLAL